MKTINCTFALIFLLLSSGLQAAQGLSYQGKIIKADGTPLTGAAVQFQISVLSPGAERCLLYQETQTANLTASNGTFSLAVGTGARVAANIDAGHTFKSIFSNRFVFDQSAAPTACSVGTSYTPASTDHRILKVSFYDGSSWQVLPDQTINQAPNAIEAQQVGGYAANQIIRVDATTPTANTEMNPVQFARFLDLMNLTLTNNQVPAWDTSGTPTWKAVTPITAETDPSVMTFAKTVLPTCAAGEVLKGNGTLLSCIPSPGGAPTGAAAGDLSGTYPNPTVATIGAVTAANVASGANLANAATNLNTASTIVKRDASGNFTAGTITANLTGNASTATSATTATTATNFTGALAGDVTGTQGATVISGLARSKLAAGTANQVLINDGAGAMYGATLTNGQLLIGSTGAAPVAATLTAGSGISITPGAGSISIATTGNQPLSGLTAATATNTIDSLNFAQNWNWSTATTQSPMSISANALTTGSGLNITTSSAALNSTNGLLNVINSGASTSGVLARFQSNSTGGSGMTIMTNGNVAIGPVIPGNKLVVAPSSGTVYSSTAVVHQGIDINNDTNGTGSGQVANLSFRTTSDSAVHVAEGSLNLVQPSGVTNQGDFAFQLKNGAGSIAEVMRVSGTGNVGIGSSIPAYKLDVAGDVNITGNFRVNGTIIGGGSGTVTTVSSANTDIGVATGTTTPVLTLNSGTGANQIVKLDGAAKMPAVDGSALTSLNASNLASGTVAAARMPSLTGDTTMAVGTTLTTTSKVNGVAYPTLPATNTVPVVTAANTITYEAVPVAAGGTGATSFANFSAIASNGSGNQVAVPGSVSGSQLQWTVAGPTWTTASFPSTTTANQILYSSATNVVGGLATAANSVMTTNGSSVPSFVSSLPATIGGTGQTVYTVGDLLYASTTTALSKLPASTSGFVLTSNGAGTAPSWQAAATGGGSLSSITAASATNTIDSLNFAQTWNWSTATTQTPMAISANALTTGSGLTLTTSSASLNSTNGLLNVANSGASTSGILARFQANSTAGSGLTILANGNVGIGTTTPDVALKVVNSSPGLMDTMRIQNTSATGDSSIGFLNQSNAYEGFLGYNNGNSRMELITSTGVPLSLGVAGTEKFRIDTTGNVGIGTTSPGGKLDVNQTTAGSIALQGQNAGTAFWKVLNPAGGATNTWNAANAIEYVGKDTGTNRSINAAGTINASGADFAEWVDWTGGAKPEMGSVILYRGSYVVVSSPFTAAFIGNDIKDPDHAILVAFAGQLPVLIHGQVHEGDLIVANDDGTARAVAKADVTLAMAQKAVGTAWASSNDPGLKRVNVAVGIGLSGGGARDIASLKAKDAEKDQKIKNLEQENAAIKAYLCSKDKKAAICK